jgi:hypothetical protein
LCCDLSEADCAHELCIASEAAQQDPWTQSASMCIDSTLYAVSQRRMQTNGPSQDEERRIQNQSHVMDGAGECACCAIQQGIGKCIAGDGTVKNLCRR